MPLLRRLGAMPLYWRIAIPVIAVVVAGSGLALALSAGHRQAPRVAVLASPSPSESPSPGESPSPSPSESPSPSPTPAPAPPAPAPAPAPPAPARTCGGPPPGGFPGGSLAASFPVALAWSPDGRLFWAERAGSVKVFEGGTVHTFASVPTTTSGERGLLGLATWSNFVFAFYSNTDGTTQSIVRWTDCAGVATNGTVIVSGIPAANPPGTDCCHKGGRLAISPDGHLFATDGDNHVPADAQNPASMRGKVTRFNLDGSGRMTWTSGLRNPFGIAFAPDGTLAVTNNGPSGDAGTPCGSCGDEFDLVGRAPGVDYQWPHCWGYSHSIDGSNCAQWAGPQYSTEGGPYPKGSPYFVAPTGMTWSTNEFGGHFLFCAYSTHEMYEYMQQGSVADTGVAGCELDVKQGPDGALYYSDEGTIRRR